MTKDKKSSGKFRADFKKGHEGRTRKNDLTRDFLDDQDQLADASQHERVSGKGRLTRRRTVMGSEAADDASGFGVALEVDPALCLSGLVQQVFGLNSLVIASDNQVYCCTVRGVLKSLATDLQHVVVAGDRVTIQTGEVQGEGVQGVIVRVEPRMNQISRTSRQRRQIIAANIDQAIIVASAAEPDLKAHLVDRFLVTAVQSRIQPIIVINKVDLIRNADLQPLIGVWSQAGYPVIVTSVKNGLGINRLRELLKERTSVVTGQSGVGKSSLLNSIEPGLNLRVGEVSSENQKGKHTTTSAQLVRLESGGQIIDTPGIRQFHLWDVIGEELPSLFRDIRPFINACRFPNCTHIHEDGCGVKWGVADNKLDVRRYESYCQMRSES
jgi:ribosome biogenesis GTPase